jgi:hypothetical protein
MRKHREKRQERRTVLEHGSCLTITIPDVPVPAGPILEKEVKETRQTMTLKMGACPVRNWISNGVNWLREYSLELAIAVVILSLFVLIGSINYLYLTERTF